MNTLVCLHKGTAQCAILQKNWYFCAENIEKDMKKVIICAVMALTMVCAEAQSFSLRDLFGKKDAATENSADDNSDGILGALGSFIGNMTANKNFTVDDIVGQWSYSSPAVSFKSENALKNVGGAAAATAVENKLAPYYKTLGFTRTTLTIAKDHTFSMKMGIIPLKGTVEKTEDGRLEFAFTGITGRSIGKVDAVATKSGSTLNLTFDATKFIKVLTSVAGKLNISTLNTLASLLNGYDGIYMGFSMKLSGEAPETAASTTSSKSSATK